MALTLVLAGVLGACQSEAPAPEADRAAPASDSATAVTFRDTITLTGTLIDATCHAQMEADAAAACEEKYV